MYFDHIKQHELDIGGISLWLYPSDIIWGGGVPLIPPPKVNAYADVTVVGGFRPILLRHEHSLCVLRNAKFYGCNWSHL